MSPNLLLYGSLPPPFTGQSAMFVPVVGLFPKGEILLVNITLFNSTLGNTVYTMLATCWFFLVYRFKTVYFTPSRSMTGFVKDIPLLLLGRWCNKRMIAHLHGANFRSFYENSGMLKPFIRYGYQHVDIGIVLLEGMRNEFGHFPNIRVKVVPNCYDQRFDIPDTSAPLSVRTDGQPDTVQPDTERSRSVRTIAQKDKRPCQVLYLSALMHSKGILEFLDAAAIVLGKQGNTSFVIAGALWADGSMGLMEITARFQTRLKVLQEQFPGRIGYRGLLKGADKITLLNESSIFVFPSWHPSEALPVSILEAMRTGNAIIATRHNFLPLLVRPENGLLVEPRSGQAIADAILALLSNKERLREIQEFNINHAVENYSIEKYRKNMREIIKPF
jgi:glycosyltransferase involved in cell wall biosynthesis